MIPSDSYLPCFFLNIPLAPESAFVVETISPVYHFVGSFDTAVIIREAIMAIQQKPRFEDKGKLPPSVSSPETTTIAGHTEI